MPDPSEHDPLTTDREGNRAFFWDVVADGLEGELDDRVPALRRLCESASPDERLRACAMLVSWCDRSGLQTLIDWASTPCDDEPVRYTGEFGWEPSFEILADALHTSSRCELAADAEDLRTEAMRALLRVAHRCPMGRELASALYSDDVILERVRDELQAAAGRSLARLEDRKDRSRLDFDLWAQTAGLLGPLAKLDDAGAAAIAERLLELRRRDPGMQLELSEAMVAGRGPSTLAVLERLRTSKHRAVREDAGHKLAHRRGEPPAGEPP